MVDVYGDLNGAAKFRQIVAANGAATYDFADGRQAGGKVHNYLEKVTVTIGEVAGTLYYVAKLPKEAVLLPTTRFWNDGGAVTGTFDFGDSSNIDALIDNNAGSAATSVPWETWTIGTYANTGLALWEQIGYATADAAPAEIELYVTLVGSTQAAADAELVFNIQYTTD